MHNESDNANEILTKIMILRFDNNILHKNHDLNIINNVVNIKINEKIILI